MSKENLVIASKVKDVLREKALRADSELVSALSDKLSEILEDAIGRCLKNGRSTVRPYDI